MKMGIRVAGTALILASFLPLARADELMDRQPGDFSETDLFAKGRYEVNLSAGVMFSPFGHPNNRPTINYAISGLQLGYMVTDLNDLGWARGNLELAGEAFGSAIFDGPGNYVAGLTLWVRYNFVPRGWRLVPFVQGGAGLTGTDIDRGLVGQDFNFNLDLGFGARYLISDRWSLNLEYRYQHISNANLGHHNIGVNSQGPLLSLSYFF